ncbi:hypothetical protein [Bacillus wiedmannii]|uniref:hypothetical protein n=1 Tax=Bacillus wiedmannii TaxID=1890302 RepID=UPI000BF0407E|nr:hypothetical protein [Bacillus wiedmannii]PEM30161.1 hypothetical protein CN598_12605 [Bacillus wiedmannii]
MRTTGYENDLIVQELIGKSTQTNLSQFAIGILTDVLVDETKAMHVMVDFDEYTPPRECLFLAHMIPDLKSSANVGKKFWVSTAGANIVIGKLHTIEINEE